MIKLENKKLDDYIQSFKGHKLKQGSSLHFKSVVTKFRNIQENSLYFLTDKGTLQKKQTFSLPTCIVVIDDHSLMNKLMGDITVIYVAHIKKAYRAFIQQYRKQFNFPFICITGSVGKTTTREMIAHILAEKHLVKRTKGNYNLFRSNAKIVTNMDEETEFGLLELGVGYQGHLNLCSRVFSPYTAVITSIGTDHIERFKTVAKYIRQKNKLLRGVGEDNAIILNADCLNTKMLKIAPYKGKVLYFGQDNKADYQAENIIYKENTVEFNLKYNGQTFPVTIPGYGIHNVYNALAAIATTHFHGISLDYAIKRLLSFRHYKRHLELKTSQKGTTILDDTWNTNSSSIKAALDVLQHIGKYKTKIAIIGKISELGDEEEKEHKKIGENINKNKVDYLITIGETASIIAEQAKNNGFPAKHTFPCTSPEQVLSIIDGLPLSNSVVLVKTSMRESFKSLMKDLMTTI